MPRYRLTSRSEADLAKIADYTIETFAIEQARRYRDGLETCLRTLAENPKLGRSTEQLAPGLRRLGYQSHVVSYVPQEEDVLIVRVLHASMGHGQHLQRSETDDT